VKRYVLLDRDGTLTRDVGYPHRLEDYELLDGVAPALRRLADAGYRLVIVTNQSGIGRGYFGYSDFERFHARLPAEHVFDVAELAGVRAPSRKLVANRLVLV
jgi:D-glycero-D-manno-heptose 1,7-bisphosphate phosphatase